ncbi:MAG: hypothetical protein KJ622_18320 [Alphaproteobacteria bacterium]|nr:hypothetical protein [Alphaproteobacteria bacterium]
MSILRIRPAIAAAIVGLSAGGAYAEPPGRFTMSPVDGGFVRLDKETGAMSLCSRMQSGQDAEGWSCVPMDDNQRDLREEVDRLKAENTRLKEEVRRMEDTFISGRGAGTDSQAGEPPAGPPGGLPPGMKLPSEEDVDRAVDYLEGMIRKFRERFDDFGEKTDPERHRRENRDWRDDRDRSGPRDDERDRGRDSRGSTPL